MRPYNNWDTVVSSVKEKYQRLDIEVQQPRHSVSLNKSLAISYVDSIVDSRKQKCARNGRTYEPFIDFKVDFLYFVID